MTHRRRPIAYAAVAEQPFSTINTTPIIDVMLVLLIMFIITLPLMTHSVKIDLPPRRPGPEGAGDSPACARLRQPAHLGRRSDRGSRAPRPPRRLPRRRPGRHPPLPRRGGNAL